MLPKDGCEWWCQLRKKGERSNTLKLEYRSELIMACHFVHE